MAMCIHTCMYAEVVKSLYLYMQDGQTGLNIASEKEHTPDVKLPLQSEQADVSMGQKV